MTDVSRTMLKLSITCLCIAALIAIVALVSGDFDETEGKVTVTTLWVAIYNLTGMGAAAALPRRELAALGTCGLVASGIGLALGTYLMWSEWDNDDLARAWGIATTVAISIAQAALLLIGRRPGDTRVIRLVRAATIVVIVVLAALIAVALAVAEDDPDEAFFRVLGCLAVLDVLGTLLVPILRRLQGSRLSATEETGKLYLLQAGALDARVRAAQEQGAELIERGTLDDGAGFAVLRAADGSAFALVERRG